VKFPTKAGIEVDGLGHGLEVDATIKSADPRHEEYSSLEVNGVKATTLPVKVKNGDKLALHLCASDAYSTPRTVSLHYGSHNDEATLKTTSAPPPPHPPPR